MAGRRPASGCGLHLQPAFVEDALPREGRKPSRKPKSRRLKPHRFRGLYVAVETATHKTSEGAGQGLKPDEGGGLYVAAKAATHKAPFARRVRGVESIQLHKEVHWQLKLR